MSLCVGKTPLFTLCVFPLISGVIPANKTIWFLGDIFLTEAIAILTQLQNQNKDELYMYQAYDVKAFFPTKLCSDSFGKQIRSQLYEAFSQCNKLPAVIILVTGNAKIDDMVTSPYHTKRIWNALFTEIDRALKARKNDLPRKCYLNEEPRVFVTNVFPRFRSHCEKVDEGLDSFRTKRRRLNNVLPQVSAKFDFDIIPINGIPTDKDEYFILSTGQLSSMGIQLFWSAVDKELKLADEKCKEKVKNKIIQAYLDDSEQMQKVHDMRQQMAASRFSTPRTFSRQNRYKNFDGYKNAGSGFRKNNRDRRGHSR